MLFFRLLRQSISAKLLALQSVLIVVIVTIAVSVNFLFLEEYITEIQSERLHSNSEIVSLITQNELTDIHNKIRSIATDPIIEKYVDTFNPKILIKHFSKFSSLFSSISYINSSGEEEIKVINGKVSDKLEIISDDFIFYESQTEPNRLLFSEPSYILNSTILNMSYRSINYFDEFLAYIKVTYPVNRLKTKIDELRIDKSIRTIIIDKNDTVIFSSSKKILINKIPIKMRNKDFTTETHTKNISLLKNDVFKDSTLVSQVLVPEYEWHIISALPDSYISTELNKAQNILMSVTLSMIIIGILISWKFLKKTIKPISLLNDLTEEISQKGNIDERVNWDSKDDVGRLAKSFNRMLDQLQKSNLELQGARQHVESIVKVIVDAVIVTEPSGLIIRANKAAIQILGLPEVDIVGQYIQELLNTTIDLVEDENSDDSREIKNLDLFIKNKHKGELSCIFSRSSIYDIDENIQNFVFVIKDVTELKEAEAHLNHLAKHDVLTNLPNRLLLLDRMEFLMSRLPWHERILAVMFLDLDRFKIINDTLGHDVGDQLLLTIASRLTKSVRSGDIVARLGGDEFVVVLNDIAQKTDVAQVAKKIIDNMNVPVKLSGQEFVITTSIGISLYPTDGNDPHLLLKNADTAMYRAKDNGRNNYMFYSSHMNAEAREQMSLENDMRHGMERNEFVVFYQPLVSLSSGKIVGAEALLRWQHPTKGMMSPMKFIPLAEENGFIVTLGEFVLSSACCQLSKWHAEGFCDISVSVNIADRQFKYTNLLNIVKSNLTKYNLEPKFLDLEITEGVLMDQVEHANEVLQEFKLMGVKLSIDDFGTGYSSLAHLKKFSVDTLKIDRSFISDIPIDKEDIAITSAILQMAKVLGLSVVAEGVETKEQVLFLQQKECEIMQGFYFSKPVPAEEFTNLLINNVTLESL